MVKSKESKKTGKQKKLKWPAEGLQEVLVKKRRKVYHAGASVGPRLLEKKLITARDPRLKDDQLAEDSVYSRRLPAPSDEPASPEEPASPDVLGPASPDAVGPAPVPTVIALDNTSPDRHQRTTVPPQQDDDDDDRVEEWLQHSARYQDDGRRSYQSASPAGDHDYRTAPLQPDYQDEDERYRGGEPGKAGDEWDDAWGTAIEPEEERREAEEGEVEEEPRFSAAAEPLHKMSVYLRQVFTRISNRFGPYRYEDELEDEMACATRNLEEVGRGGSVHARYRQNYHLVALSAASQERAAALPECPPLKNIQLEAVRAWLNRKPLDMYVAGRLQLPPFKPKDIVSSRLTQATLKTVVGHVTGEMFDLVSDGESSQDNPAYPFPKPASKTEGMTNQVFRQVDNYMGFLVQQAASGRPMPELDHYTDDDPLPDVNDEDIRQANMAELPGDYLPSEGSTAGDESSKKKKKRRDKKKEKKDKKKKKKDKRRRDMSLSGDEQPQPDRSEVGGPRDMSISPTPEDRSAELQTLSEIKSRVEKKKKGKRARKTSLDPEQDRYHEEDALLNATHSPASSPRLESMGTQELEELQTRLQSEVHKVVESPFGKDFGDVDYRVLPPVPAPPAPVPPPPVQPPAQESKSSHLFPILTGGFAQNTFKPVAMESVAEPVTYPKSAIGQEPVPPPDPFEKKSITITKREVKPQPQQDDPRRSYSPAPRRRSSTPPRRRSPSPRRRSPSPRRRPPSHRRSMSRSPSPRRRRSRSYRSRSSSRSYSPRHSPRRRYSPPRRKPPGRWRSPPRRRSSPPKRRRSSHRRSRSYSPRRSPSPRSVRRQVSRPQKPPEKPVNLQELRVQAFKSKRCYRDAHTTAVRDPFCEKLVPNFRPLFDPLRRPPQHQANPFNLSWDVVQYFVENCEENSEETLRHVREALPQARDFSVTSLEPETGLLWALVLTWWENVGRAKSEAELLQLEREKDEKALEGLQEAGEYGGVSEYGTVTEGGEDGAAPMEVEDDTGAPGGDVSMESETGEKTAKKKINRTNFLSQALKQELQARKNPGSVAATSKPVRLTGDEAARKPSTVRKQSTLFIPPTFQTLVDMMDEVDRKNQEDLSRTGFRLAGSKKVDNTMHCLLKAFFKASDTVVEQVYGRRVKTDQSSQLAQAAVIPHLGGLSRFSRGVYAKQREDRHSRPEEGAADSRKRKADSDVDGASSKRLATEEGSMRVDSTDVTDSTVNTKLQKLKEVKERSKFSAKELIAAASLKQGYTPVEDKVTPVGLDYKTMAVEIDPAAMSQGGYPGEIGIGAAPPPAICAAPSLATPSHVYSTPPPAAPPPSVYTPPQPAPSPAAAKPASKWDMKTAPPPPPGMASFLSMDSPVPQKPPVQAPPSPPGVTSHMYTPPPPMPQPAAPPPPEPEMMPPPAAMIEEKLEPPPLPPSEMEEPAAPGTEDTPLPPSVPLPDDKKNKRGGKNRKKITPTSDPRLLKISEEAQMYAQAMQHLPDLSKPPPGFNSTCTPPPAPLTASTGAEAAYQQWHRFYYGTDPGASVTPSAVWQAWWGRHGGTQSWQQAPPPTAEEAAPITTAAPDTATTASGWDQYYGWSASQQQNYDYNEYYSQYTAAAATEGPAAAPEAGDYSSAPPVEAPPGVDTAAGDKDSSAEEKEGKETKAIPKLMDLKPVTVRPRPRQRPPGLPASAQHLIRQPDGDPAERSNSHVRAFVFRGNEEKLCVQAEQMLKFTGARMFDPHQIRLLTTDASLDILVLVHSSQRHRIQHIPNLPQLKQHPRVRFCVYDDVAGVQKYARSSAKEGGCEEVMVHGTLLLLDDTILPSMRPELLTDLFKYLERQQADKGVPWVVIIHNRQINHLQELVRQSGPDDSARLQDVLNVLFQFSERDMVKILARHGCDAHIKPPYEYLSCMVRCQIENKDGMTFRHVLMLSDLPTAKFLPQFLERGFGVISYQNFMASIAKLKPGPQCAFSMPVHESDFTARSSPVYTDAPMSSGVEKLNIPVPPWDRSF